MKREIKNTLISVLSITVFSLIMFFIINLATIKIGYDAMPPVDIRRKYNAFLRCLPMIVLMFLLILTIISIIHIIILKKKKAFSKTQKLLTPLFWIVPFIIFVVTIFIAWEYIFVFYVVSW